MHKKGSLKKIDASGRLGPVEDDEDDNVYYDVDVNPSVNTVGIDIPGYAAWKASFSGQYSLSIESRLHS
jgi:hypothetical protein